MPQEPRHVLIQTPRLSNLTAKVSRNCWACAFIPAGENKSFMLRSHVGSPFFAAPVPLQNGCFPRDWRASSILSGRRAIAREFGVPSYLVVTGGAELRAGSEARNLLGLDWSDLMSLQKTVTPISLQRDRVLSFPRAATPCASRPARARNPESGAGGGVNEPALRSSPRAPQHRLGSFGLTLSKLF